MAGCVSVCICVSRQLAWGLDGGILQVLVRSLGFKLWWVEPYRVEAESARIRPGLWKELWAGVWVGRRHRSGVSTHQPEDQGQMCVG